MSPAESAAIDTILAKIDAAIGPPEDETDAEHEKRQELIESALKAGRIRRAAQPSV